MPETAKKEKKEKSDFNINIDEMARAGLHFGHRTSKVNPKIKPYLYGIRNGIHIFDLEKTAEKLKEAMEFVKELIAENKIILIVGTKVQMRKLTEEFAKDCKLPYVSERWLGGTFTNFETILKRINYSKDLEKKKADGELEKYTKKEKARIDKVLKDLEIKIGGIKNMAKLPDAILILDIKKDILALKEAKMKGIKIIAITDTNVDPDSVDYPIPANDDAMSSIKYIIDKIKEVILKVK